MSENEGMDEGLKSGLDEALKRGQEVTLAEIERDSQMVVLGLLRRLAALQVEQVTLALACGRVEDPIELCEAVEAAVEVSREDYRRLNDARIMRRSRGMAGFPTTPGTPARLRAFARHGEYVGGYGRLGAMVRAMAGAEGRGRRVEELGEDVAGFVDVDGIGLEMHLQGELWTIDEAGEVHAFRVREPGGDGDGGDGGDGDPRSGGAGEPMSAGASTGTSAGVSAEPSSLRGVRAEDDEGASP